MHAWKVSKYGVFSGPYFPAFAVNTETYGVNLRIQFECRKIRTRKNSVFGYFSRSDELTRVVIARNHHIISHHKYDAPSGRPDILFSCFTLIKQ